MRKITPGIGSATQKTPVYQILYDSLNFTSLGPNNEKDRAS